MGIAAGMKDIVQDIVSSYDARVADLKGLKKEANEMLGSFKASHKKMGAQLRKDLAQEKAKMRGEVRTMRSGFQSSRKEMSTELRKNLAQGEAARKSEAQQLRKELADYDRGIKSEVAGMRQETKADLGEARTTWQGLAHTMEAKRARVKVPPKAKVPIAKEEIAEELPDLEAKLLAAINKHPNGITLTEVADSLGVVPIVLGRAARSLLDKGKVRKEDKLYFPVRAE